MLNQKLEKAKKILAKIKDFKEKFKKEKEKMQESSDAVSELARVKAELELAKEEISKLRLVQKELDITKEELNKVKLDLIKAREELEDIKKQLARYEKLKFIIIVVKWETEKHDVDLYVKDPKGKVFNFKKKKYKNHPGELIIDSRSGPGVEVWQAENFITGVYELQYKFYNNYGNNKPVVVSTYIVTKTGKIKVKPITMDFFKNKEEILKINISDTVKVLN